MNLLIGELRILGCLVMEDFEAPYMKKMAGVACARGGRILEIGFGLGISAKYIDEYCDGSAGSPVTQHVIIEANAEVAARAREFAKTSKVNTTVLEGFWQERVDSLEPGSFQGVFFDSFPVTEDEFKDNSTALFYPVAHRLLEKDGVFTFFVAPDTEEQDWWKQTQLDFQGEITEQLQHAGFTNITYDKALCQPPGHSAYIGKDKFLVPIVTK
eukprot:gnl/TRDRNA2_/TRDRNA2_159814_c0_seq1.p1 gnl/TRDRNA2_/TRDRNA2_159814_c0~~gnl/TRDRNA2_/TRDRNA2_159814_c0_seq1.p1  ORF type:complete len:213 (+),score=32.96 gnl/TRDRNA2_/TRDRNA2_159814_c0_seq1:65-703(+)